MYETIENNAHKGIFQNCTLNNPAFDIVIKISLRTISSFLVCSYSFSYYTNAVWVTFLLGNLVVFLSGVM